MKNAKWFLTDHIYVYFKYDNSTVYISNPNDKKFYTCVKKNSESIKNPLLLENKDFKITFKKGLVYIDIQGTDYVIANTYLNDVVSQFSSLNLTVTNGIIEGVKFGFSLEDLSASYMFLPGSDAMIEAEKEAYNRDVVSLMKKTKKFEVGYEYSDGNNSYVYLGTYFKRIPNYSVNYASESLKEVCIFIQKEFYKNQSSLEDIFTSEHKITYLTGLPSFLLEGLLSISKENLSKGLVQLGKVFDDPNAQSFKLEEHYEEIIRSYMGFSPKLYSPESSLYYYNGVYNLIDFLEYSTTNTPSIHIKPDCKNLMEEIISVLTKYFLIKSISSSGTKEEFSKSVVGQMTCYMSSKYYSDTYIETRMKKKLLDQFGIALDDVVKDTVDKIDIPALMDGSFKNFIEYSIRYPRSTTQKEIDFYIMDRSNKSLETFLSENLKKVYNNKGDQDYVDLITQIIIKSLEYGGSNLKASQSMNVGTPTKPKIIYNFIISLSDIVNFLKVDTVFDLPEKIKETIRSSKTLDLVVRIDQK